jgi:hypothetical protein
MRRRSSHPAIPPLLTLELRARHLERCLEGDLPDRKRYYFDRELHAIEFVFAELGALNPIYGELIDLVAHRADEIESERQARTSAPQPSPGESPNHAPERPMMIPPHVVIEIDGGCGADPAVLGLADGVATIARRRG